MTGRVFDFMAALVALFAVLSLSIAVLMLADPTPKWPSVISGFAFAFAFLLLSIVLELTAIFENGRRR